MLQRIVCFKFKENSTEDQVTKHISQFGELKEKICQIKSYSAGKTVKGDFGAQPEYDIMHYLTFNSLKDIDDYFEHKEHQDFIAENKEIWEKELKYIEQKAEDALQDEMGAARDIMKKRKNK